jgi:hypothetical protein
MKALLTILVWFFVPLMMVEAVVCNGGPGTAAAARDTGTLGCAVRWPILGDRVAAAARNVTGRNIVVNGGAAPSVSAC